MIITLDGPCGSGKSTLAQRLAHKLGFFYINSGYLYRSIAYLLVHEFGYDDAKLQQPHIQDIQFIVDEHNFMYQYKDGVARVLFRGQDITHCLKSSAVSHYSSIISAHEQVRKIVVILQQKFGQEHNLVTDGRDGGTEIYPQAQFKFYVTASPEIRASRLQVDFIKGGVKIDFDEALQMTLARDERDMTRLISPLKKADDAIEIDTSYQSVDQILNFILSIVQK